MQPLDRARQLLDAQATSTATSILLHRAAQTAGRPHSPADDCELHLQLPAGQLNGPRPRLNLDLQQRTAGMVSCGFKRLWCQALITQLPLQLACLRCRMVLPLSRQKLHPHVSAPPSLLLGHTLPAALP